MGAYLSTPSVEKKSDNYEDSERFSVGVSGMQGWRISMEDSHNCVPDLEEDTSLFGVYDGHGGSEVAIYCSLHFAEILKETEAYERGDYKSALEDAFMKIDKVLIEPGTIRELKVLANRDPDDGPPTEADFQAQDAEEDYEEDETKLLYEEATMSIEELLARYGKAANDTKAAMEKLKESRTDDEKPSEVKEEAGGSVKSAEPSSSSSSQNPRRKTETSAKASTTEETSGSPSNGAIAQSDNQVAGSSSSAKEPQNGPVSSASEVGKAEPAEAAQEESAGESDDSTPKIKKVNVKVKPQPKASSKVQPSKAKPLQALLDDEDMEDDSDSEDGFDSDEAVEGSSDSEQEDSTEEEDDEEEDDEPNVLEMPNPTAVEEPGKDSGTTAVVALLHGRDLYVANAGDSRCVLSRKGKALDMSEDHKPEDEIEMKRIKAAGGHVNFQGRVNGGLNLSRAIGDHCYKMNADLELRDQMISAMPDVRKIRLLPGDEFMVLACDGIWNVFSSQEVVDFMQVRIPTVDEKADYKLSSMCEELFDICLAPDTMGDGTGCDNMTCIMVRFNQKWLEKCEAEDPTPPEEELDGVTDSEQTREIIHENDPSDEKDSNSKITLDGEAKENSVTEAVAERNSHDFSEPNCGDNQKAESKMAVKACKRPRTDDSCDQDTDADGLPVEADESKRPRVA